jgi:hypothetical protein
MTTLPVEITGKKTRYGRGTDDKIRKKLLSFG